MFINKKNIFITVLFALTLSNSFGPAEVTADITGCDYYSGYPVLVFSIIVYNEGEQTPIGSVSVPIKNIEEFKIHEQLDLIMLLSRIELTSIQLIYGGQTETGLQEEIHNIHKMDQLQKQRFLVILLKLGRIPKMRKARQTSSYCGKKLEPERRTIGTYRIPSASFINFLKGETADRWAPEVVEMQKDYDFLFPEPQAPHELRCS